MGVRISPEADAYFRAITGADTMYQPMLPSVDINQRYKT